MRWLVVFAKVAIELVETMKNLEDLHPYEDVLQVMGCPRHLIESQWKSAANHSATILNGNG